MKQKNEWNTLAFLLKKQKVQFVFKFTTGWLGVKHELIYLLLNLLLSVFKCNRSAYKVQSLDLKPQNKVILM